MHRLRALTTLLALSALGACTQGVSLETRTFELAHLFGSEAEDLVEPYVFADREGAPGTMSAIENALTVRETADNLDRIERVLAQFDVPSADVRLHFQLIEAGPFRASDERIAAVEDELRRLFRHQGYRLAGEAFVTATDGSEIMQSLSGTDDLYEVHGTIYRARGAIRLEEVRLYATQPGVGLSTTVNIRPGQTIVLGSSNDGSNGSTLFLVVTAMEL